MSKIDEVDAVLATLNKQFGTGSVYEVGKFDVPKEERIPSGSMGIDSITGGGYPEGRIVEIYGGESSGKSTLALQAVREAQVKHPNKRVLYVDSEHAISLDYAANLGVDVDKLIFSQPDTMEQGYEIIDKLVKTGMISLVIFDSIAQSQTASDLAGEIGDQSMGVKARLMSKSMPKFTTIFNKTKTAGIWINQIREKIGVMFGNPETTPGGNAMKFSAGIRIELRRQAPKADDKDKESEVLSNTIKAKCIKNKTAVPFKVCEYKINFGSGVDNVKEIVYFGEKYGVIKKSGSWFSYGDVKLGQGTNGVAVLLEDNPELMEELMEKIKEFTI